MLIFEPDIIWNISLICPWDCEFCCTDAVNVTRGNGNIIIRSNGLENCDYCVESEVDQWPVYLSDLGIFPNYLDKALSHRQKAGAELSLKSKLKVLDNIDSVTAHIDFAGGDPLACAENLIVIVNAAKKFGRDNISITSTGHSLSRYPLDVLCNNIGVFEFTYDEPKSRDSENRPRGYNSSNLTAARKMAELGVYTKCQIPLHSGNLTEEKINKIIHDLASSGVDEILLMRTFPVGRGLKYFDSHDQPKRKTIMDQISDFKRLSRLNNGPKIRLQCALRHLYESDGENPCDLMRDSYGINYQGLLLSSAWATNSKGGPLADEFILGNLVDERFSLISCSEKFRRLQNRLDENWGHCKIFSFLHSNLKSEDAIFAKSDPLYVESIDSTRGQ